MMITEQIFPSPFGEWRVASAAAPVDLSDVVVSFWESGGDVAFSHERMAPSGNVDLIFNLAGPQVLYPEGELDKAVRFERVWLSGLMQAPLHTGPALDCPVQPTHLVGVQMKPEAVSSLFGLPGSEMAGHVIEADQLFRTENVNLAWEQVAEAETTTGRFAAVMGFIRQCRDRLSRPAPFEALWAVGTTRQTHGQMKVAELCNELGVSRKHLADLFRRTVGLTPKAYGRLNRFRAAMDILHRDPRPDFAGLAAELGYADQPHFIAEFSQFAGEAPGRFMASRSADGESVLFER